MDDTTEHLNNSILNDLMQLNSESEPRFVEGLIDRFETLIAEKIAEMRVALDTGDRDRLFKVAHSLKGSGANLGAVALADICRDLQTDSQAANFESLGGMVDGLEYLAPRTLEALRQYVRTA